MPALQVAEIPDYTEELKAILAQMEKPSVSPLRPVRESKNGRACGGSRAMFSC